MYYPTPYIHLPEVIDREALREWHNSLDNKHLDKNCPKEIVQFIDAVANELPQFERFGVHNLAITGHELHLANIHEMHGEKIFKSFVYELPVPFMRAVDHRGAMLRAWHKRKRAGLEEYVKAHCDKQAVPKLLRAMKTELFKDAIDA
jgi:hypothetical protein